MPGPELTVDGRTSLSELQRFAQDVPDGHQIRAKKNEDGSIRLYSKDPNKFSFGFKKKQRPIKFQAAKEAISQVLENTGMADEGISGALKNLFDSRIPEGKDAPVTGDQLKALTGESTSAWLAHLSELQPLAVKERHQVMVAMGQGAAGPMGQLQIYSDSFQSCVPLIMFNAQTKVGGLFHIPALSGDHHKIEDLPEDVQKAIRGMLEYVNPTEVRIYRGMDSKDDGHLAAVQLKQNVAFAEAQETRLQKTLQQMCETGGVDAQVEVNQSNVGTTLVTIDGEGGLDIMTGGDARVLESGGNTNMHTKEAFPQEQLGMGWSALPADVRQGGAIPHASKIFSQT